MTTGWISVNYLGIQTYRRRVKTECRGQQTVCLLCSNIKRYNGAATAAATTAAAAAAVLKEDVTHGNSQISPSKGRTTLLSPALYCIAFVCVCTQTVNNINLAPWVITNGTPTQERTMADR